MSRVTTVQRIYFFAVGIMAFWVGYWCTVSPELAANGIPWSIPPLCATFLGAMYLSGGMYAVLCIFSKRWDEIKLFMPVCALWTGGLAIVSLFYLDAFDYSRHQTQIWWLAYIVYPIVAVVFLWMHRGEWNWRPRSSTLLGEGGRIFLRIQGSALLLLAMALLFAPAFMQSLWPWKTGVMMLQMYSMPLLAYGVSSWLMTTMQSWSAIRSGLVALAIFAATEIVGSLRFGYLLNGPTLAVDLWLGGLFFSALGVLILVTLSLRQTWTSPQMRRALVAEGDMA